MIQGGRLQRCVQALTLEGAAGPLDCTHTHAQNLGRVRIGAARTPGPRIHLQKNLRPAAAEGRFTARMCSWVRSSSLNVTIKRLAGMVMGFDARIQCTPIIFLQCKKVATLDARAVSSDKSRFYLLRVSESTVEICRIQDPFFCTSTRKFIQETLA